MTQLWTLWTTAPGSSLSMGFCRQEYWSELPCPPPGDLPHAGIDPVSSAAPALQVNSLLLSYQRSPPWCLTCYLHPSSSTIITSRLRILRKKSFLFSYHFLNLCEIERVWGEGSENTSQKGKLNYWFEVIHWEKWIPLVKNKKAAKTWKQNSQAFFIYHLLHIFFLKNREVSGER